MHPELSSYPDEQLITLIKKGDRIAYAEVYERYWPLLYRNAMKILKNEGESEDVVQEVFISFWNKVSELKTGASLRFYLYAATRNRILNLISRQHVHAHYLDDLGRFMKGDYEITDHLVREKMLAELIEREISKLPPRMKEVFELKRKQNLSYQDIAEKMNISELTVKTQMNKAITTLRKKFGNHMDVLLLFL